MTQSTDTTPCTEQEKAEWDDLHDRAHKAFDAADAAARLAAMYLFDHVAAGGMAPSEFGVPSEEALRTYRYACEEATKGATLRSEYRTLRDEAQAHPYTAELNARREARSERTD